MRALGEALVLFWWQAWYAVKPPACWRDGMGGDHPRNVLARQRILRWQIARHENPWALRIRLAFSLATLPVAFAIIAGGVLWALCTPWTWRGPDVEKGR